MAISEEFRSKFTQTGAEQVAKDVDKIGKASASAGTSMSKTLGIMKTFRNVLVALSFLRAADHAITFVDSLKQVQNQIKSVSTDYESFQTAQAAIFDMAKKNRLGILDQTESYVDLTRALAQHNVSQEETLRVTDLISKTVKVSGNSFQYARETLDQFNRDLAQGNVTQGTFQQLLIKVPPLAESIARGLGIASGELANFAKNNPGLVSTQNILKALASDASNVQREFDAMGTTLREALGNVSTGFQEYIAQSTVAKTAVVGITSGFNALSNNIGVLIGVVIAGAGALITLGANSGIAAKAMEYLVTIMSATGPLAFARNMLFLAGALTAFAQPIADAINYIGGFDGAITSTYVSVVLFGAALVPYLIAPLTAVGVAIGSAVAWLFSWNSVMALGAVVNAAWGATISILIGIQSLWFIATTALLAPMATLGTLMAFIEGLIAGPAFLAFAGWMATIVVAAGLAAGTFVALGGTLEGLNKLWEASVDWVKSWFAEGTILGGVVDWVSDKFKGLTGRVHENTDAVQENLDSYEKWRKEQAAFWKEHTTEVKKATVDWTVFGLTATGALQGITSNAATATSAVQALGSAVSAAGNSAAASGGSPSSSGSSGYSGSEIYRPQNGAGFSHTPSKGSSASLSAGHIEDLFNKGLGQSAGAIPGGAYLQVSKMIDDARITRQQASDLFAAIPGAVSKLLSGDPSGLDYIKNALPGGDRVAKVIKDQFGDALQGAKEYTTKTLMQQIPRGFGGLFDVFIAQALARLTGSFLPAMGGFRSGGSFMVPGNSTGNPDSVSANLRLHPGERVTVETSQQQKADRQLQQSDGTVINVTFNVDATDADSFRRNRAQVENDLLGVVTRAANRMNRR